MIEAATAYRQVGARATVLGAFDSLENIVSSPLPDGAQCWVIENRSVYRFDKGSTEAASPPRIVAPIAGGGRWYRMPVSPIRMETTSMKIGNFSGNASAAPGARLCGLVMQNVPAGSSVLAYGTFSSQPPTAAGGLLLLTYQSSQNTAIQVMLRSQFAEDTATRRSWATAGFLGPFTPELSWLFVRMNFQSLVANSMTFQWPPDQASLTMMVLPPLTKV